MSIMHINEENFDKEVNGSEIPVIIDFWAAWCSPCLMMAPVFEELSKEYEGKLKFSKLNVDDEPSLASRFGITGIPALIVFEKGNKVDSIIGFAPKEVIKQKIDSILENI